MQGCWLAAEAQFPWELGPEAVELFLLKPVSTMVGLPVAAVHLFFFERISARARRPETAEHQLPPKLVLDGDRDAPGDEQRSLWSGKTNRSGSKNSPHPADKAN